MHWSSKLNLLNSISSPSPTKPEALQDASGMATRRPLELLNDDELPPRLPMAKGVLGDGLASSTSSTASFSVDQSRTHRPTSRQPSTPLSKKERAGPGSAVRSILREPNTPGTGQSVRFFSRDAFKVISPRASTASSPANSPYPVQDFQLPEPEELEEDEPIQSMEKSDERSRSVSLVLAEEGEPATNLFDMSLDMPPIPPPQDASDMLSDDAIEVPESENGRSDAPSQDSIPEEVRRAVDQSSFMPAFPGMLPKTPVKKRSSLEEDSVANTTTYWTPRSLFPFLRASPSTSPTTVTPSAPTTTTTITSSDVNFGVYIQLLSTLREELDLQKKMNKQIELDLDNRDQLVEILCMRVENAETELEEWRKDGEEQEKAVSLLKKQLLGLERMCTKLQGMDFRVDGVATTDDSMKSSASIGDEASSQALKTLKERIRALEDEKEDLRERLRNGEDDNSDIVGLIDERNELREKVAALEEVDNLQRKEIDDLQRKLKEAVNDAPKTNDQMRFLQEELEAQWERTEKAEEELTKLRNQNAELKVTVTKLQGERSEDINAELADQLNEMMASQQALEEEKDQISEELEASRKQVEDLVASHSELQRKLEQTEQEVTFAAEKVERLQAGLSSRDRELQVISSDHQAQFSEMESLRGKLLSADKDHARKLSEATRQIDELRMQLDITSESSNRIVQETAERDVYLAALEEKANTRLEECERLRRRVHALEQESAAREVITVELKREKERVKDDNLNLNIALDSKQQELEMIKRKLGVKGTGGATPAPNRPKNAPRESSIFGVTPRPLTGFNKAISETPATVKVPPSIFSSSISSSVRTSNDGAFGPKTITRPRESVGSPTTNINVFTRPAFARSTMTATTRFGLGGIGIGLEEEEEKENLAPLRTSRRPNLMVNA